MPASMAQCAPKPATADRNEIEFVAKRTRDRLHKEHSGSIESLLRSMGIAVRDQPTKASIDERHGAVRLIMLPDGTGECRRRATGDLDALHEALAESLAHATLHAKRDAVTIFQAYPEEGDEDGMRVFTQALWFSDVLLMPEEAFGAQDADPEALARRHGVSERSARRRIARLAKAAATA